MEKRQFSLLHVDHLPNEQASALINLTVEDALLVRSEMDETGNAALTELVENATAFRAQTNRSQKSRLTEQVKTERIACSDVFFEIKKIIVFECTSREVTKKSAAENFRIFLTPYWEYMKSPIGDQMDQTVELMLKYKKNAGLISAAKIIAIDPLMTELETGNVTLKATFKARELEDGSQEPSGSDLRPAATVSFNRFSNIIEQAAIYTHNQGVLELFIKMDELRKRYHALIPPKKIKGTPPPVV